jgi:LysR family glycine cleavage system transcriptional activator
MLQRIPTLKSLQAFEAVARLNSFRHAADELCVTHAAVSHQVKALEQELGVSLFNRTTRMVELTAKGRLYYPFVRDGFSSIAQGTQRIKTHSADKVLVVRSYSTFTNMWLLPRLINFQKNHPGIPVRLRTSSEDPLETDQDYDVGIFKSPGYQPKINDIPLFRNDCFPVCSPDYLDSEKPITDLNNLKHYKLLGARVSELDPLDWQHWFAATGQANKNLTLDIEFDNYSMAREAILSAQGVAIARKAFVTRDLERGNLIRPFEGSVVETGQWHFTCSDIRQGSERAQLFKNWLFAAILEDENFHPSEQLKALIQEPSQVSGL